jgi:carbamoyl-phosphate synthase large subunit
VNILITSASRKVSLVREFQNAIRQEGGGKIIAADTSPFSAALYRADDHFLIPSSDNSRFIPTLLKLCEQEEIKMIIPTRDEELLPFARHRKEFKAVGTTVVVSSAEVIEKCQDKKAFNDFCRQHNFVVPDTYEQDEVPHNIEFPLFVKPRQGKGGKGVLIAYSIEELRVALSRMPDALIQTFIDAPEYTVDLFADFDGTVISIVPRERIYIFGGESFISRTSKNRKIIDESLRLANELKLIGHNTIQCFLHDGIIKFIEVNPRFGGGAHLGMAAGAPTPLFIIQSLKGKKLKPRIGDFKDNYVMLRYTEDLLLDGSKLSDKKFL